MNYLPHANIDHVIELLDECTDRIYLTAVSWNDCASWHEAKKHANHETTKYRTTGSGRPNWNRVKTDEYNIDLLMFPLF